MLLLAWSLAAAEVVAAEDEDDWGGVERAGSALLLTVSLQLQPHLAWFDNELLRLPRKVDVEVVAEVVVVGVVNAIEQLLFS